MLVEGPMTVHNRAFKVGVPNSVRHLNVSDMRFGVIQECVPKKTHVCVSDWILCAKKDNHSRFNSQPNWGGAIWPFNDFDNE